MSTLPVVRYPRETHDVRREQIAASALAVTHRLRAAGFEARIVGGAVRDLMLGREPDDFDVATDAIPDQILKLFPEGATLSSSGLPIVMINSDGEVVDVATFRISALHNPDGLLKATVNSDVYRRDFTINAMLFDVEDESIWAHPNSLCDLTERVLRPAKDVESTLLESPERLLRSVRLALKLDFTLAPDLVDAIKKHKSLLDRVTDQRVSIELHSAFKCAKPDRLFTLLCDTELLELLSSGLVTETESDPKVHFHMLQRQYMGDYTETAL